MVVKVPSGIARVHFRISASVDLSKESFRRNNPCSHHEGLVTVIPRPPVTIPEILGHGDLRHLLAIPKNAEFRLPGQHLLPGNYTAMPANVSKAVIFKHFFPESIKGDLLYLLLLHRLNLNWYPDKNTKQKC